jgi:hypothetical protein
MTGDSLRFEPFYERRPGWFPALLFKILVALLLGAAFLGPHAWAVGGKVVADWSWLLAVLIAVATLALYYATATLRGLLPGMSLRLRPPDHEGLHDPRRHRNDKVFLDPINRTLSSGNFIGAGIAIGALNCLVGLGLGVPCDKPGFWTTLFGFFLAGFVCGMAAWGIYGVTVIIAAFAKHARENRAQEVFDYTAPDHCGGVQFIGEALVVFSSVTLLVGALISIYIRVFPWTNSGKAWFAPLEWVWIVLPYLLSVIVLMGPAVPINDALRRYRLREEDDLLRALHGERRKLAAVSDQAEVKETRDRVTRLQDNRKELHAMGTWPQGMSANLKYLGIFFANLVASAGTTMSTGKSLLATLFGGGH